jgi:hypothetical protein
MKVNEIANLVLESYPFVFRNDNGMAYVGGVKMIVERDGNVFMRKGWTVIMNPRKIHYGLQPGSGDFVGWTPLIVTTSMVGQKIAVFTSIETKTVHDYMKQEQQDWLNAVREAGGIAEVWQDTHDGIVKT